jgi:hypothetical protein
MLFSHIYIYVKEEKKPIYVGRSLIYVVSVTQIMYATLYFIVIHLLSFRYPFPVPIFIYVLLTFLLPPNPGTRCVMGRLQAMKVKLGKIHTVVSTCHNNNNKLFNCPWAVAQWQWLYACT